MKKKILIPLFLVFSTFGLANDDYETYTILGKKISIYYSEEFNVTASQPCKLSSKNKSYCINYSFLKKVSSRDFERSPAGNPNPGALICEDQLGGLSIIGFDKDENEMSFCHLSKENIFISNGTLSYYADKNDSSGPDYSTFKTIRKSKQGP